MSNYEWLYNQYIVLGKGASKIGKDIGVSQDTIYRYLGIHKIPIRRHSKFTLRRLPEDIINCIDSYEWLYSHYVELEQSAVSIAKQLNVSYVTIYTALERHNIPRRDNKDSQLVVRSSKLVREKLSNRDWLYNKIYIENNTLPDITKELECSYQTVYYYAKKYDLIRTPGTYIRKPDHCKKLSIASKKNWRPEMVRHTHKNFPNKPEKLLQNIIYKYDLKYRYVGNGTFWIDRINPDFVYNGKHKIIIEVFGDYWHNLEDSYLKDAQKGRRLSELGWKRIIIWEHELYECSEDDILLKILLEGDYDLSKLS